MEASCSPSPPLGAVRTVYPKLSRNAFSHSSTSRSSSMQRTILLLRVMWKVEHAGHSRASSVHIVTCGGWSILLRLHFGTAASQILSRIAHLSCPRDATLLA